MISPLLCSRCS